MLEVKNWRERFQVLNGFEMHETPKVQNSPEPLRQKDRQFDTPSLESDAGRKVQASTEGAKLCSTAS